MSKEIKKITADEVYPVSMKRLADRPNSSSAQGRGGMSAAELKGFMDKYPALVKERLNELIELINAGSADGLTTILKAPVVDETTGKEISLYEWIVQAGKTHESLQAEIGKKLNKVTEIPDGDKRYVYLIAKVNGEVGVYLYEAAVENENGAFVVRNPAGNIFITQAHVSAPPVNGTNIATKDYVDKNVASTAYIDAGLEKKLDKTGGTVTGNLTIEKNLVVKGKTQTVDAETLKVKDKLIIVASGNTAPLTSPAGLLAPKYDGEHYGALVFDSTGTAMVGDVSLDEDGNISSVNDLQPLATRGDISDGNLAKWDQTKQTLVGAGASSVNPAGNTFAQRDESGVLYGESGTGNKALVNLQQMTAAISAAVTSAPIDVVSMDIEGVDLASYDTTNGMNIVYGGASIQAVDPNTHETITDNIPYTTIQLPIKPGKYIDIDADSNSTAIEVKVDDAELSKAYIKQPTSTIDVAPVYEAASKSVKWRTATHNANSNSVVLRDANSDSKFGKVYCNEILRLSDGYQAGTANQLRFAVTTNADFTVAKTSTDTGSITSSNLALLQQFTQMHIVYDNQLYYRMDPLAAPDGTLNFIHIDSVQDDSGGYKATGKCFSIATATRAWQVVDIGLGGTSGGNTYRHHVTIAVESLARSFEVDLYKGNKILYTLASLRSAILDKPLIAYTSDIVAPVRLSISGTTLTITESSGTETATWIDSNITITDV